jgi:hypothetical protein
VARVRGRVRVHEREERLYRRRNVQRRERRGSEDVGNVGNVGNVVPFFL